MKKVAFILASLLAMMLAGCGEGSSSAGGSSTANPSENNEVVEVNNGDVTNTTITNEFGLNPSLGTPPPLPAG
jgi:outer membrane lipoprotein SlyB